VLTAEARARARYGRNGVYDVTVTRGDQLIAEFRGRSHQTGRLQPRRSCADGGAQHPNAHATISGNSSPWNASPCDPARPVSTTSADNGCTRTCQGC
jgi:hypothetical protein